MVRLKWELRYLSHPIRKPTICICENKGTDQLRSFATRIVHFLFFINLKFQASSLLLLLHRPVCVGPVRKPCCLFSHETAHIFEIKYMDVL